MGKTSLRVGIKIKRKRSLRNLHNLRCRTTMTLCRSTWLLVASNRKSRYVHIPSTLPVVVPTIHDDDKRQHVPVMLLILITNLAPPVACPIVEANELPILAPRLAVLVALY